MVTPVSYTLAAFEDENVRDLAVQLISVDRKIMLWGCVSFSTMYEYVVALSDIPLVKHRVDYMQGILQGIIAYSSMEKVHHFVPTESATHIIDPQQPEDHSLCGVLLPGLAPRQNFLSTDAKLCKHCVERL